MRRVRSLLLVVGLTGVLLAACGGDDASVGSDGSADGERPTVVVTTNILGDVVEQVAGEQVDVVTIMPVGADPHTFQASAQQAAQMRDADVLVVNGAGFEEGLLDVIDAAVDDGAMTFEAMSAVEPLEFGAAAHDHEDEEHSDEEHSDEEHSDEDGHEHQHEGDDPHFFTDPVRMWAVVDAMADFFAENVEGIDTEALQASADDYVAELEALDADLTELVGEISEDRRILVTNHEVFGYFGDRYGFEIVGTVIPSGSTGDGASAGALAELAEVIEQEGVAAVFADTSSSNDLADTLAEEAGDVEVVELFSESLGEPDSGGGTYIEMVRTNVQRIVDGLTG